jgi:hypothetical protein
MVLITQDIVRTEKLPAASKSPALDARSSLGGRLCEGRHGAVSVGKDRAPGCVS